MRSARGLLACLLALAACFFVSAVSAGAETVPLPPGSLPAAQQSDSIDSVSCPAAGDCVGVGTVNYASSSQQALIETEQNGVWTPSALNVSGLPNTNQRAELYSVSCFSVGNCGAAGYYYYGSGNSTSTYGAVMATDVNGTWTASAPDLTGLTNPGSATSLAEFYQADCYAAGDCTAVGGYVDNLGHWRPLIETEQNGVLTTTEGTLQGLALSSNPDSFLTSVACTSAGNCTAAGYYYDSAGYQQVLIETETGGAWTASSPSTAGVSGLPAGSGDASLNQVACSSDGNCAAVGTYQDTSNASQGLILTETGGTWTATEANVSGFSTGGVDLLGASCPSAGNCTAVGTYVDSSSNNQGLEVSQVAGQWQAAVAATPPVGAASDPSLALDSVQCSSAGNCLAAGTYNAADGNAGTVVARETSGSWQTAGLAGPSASTAHDAYFYGSAAVSCAPSGYCAVGGYTYAGATTGYYSAFLLDASAAPGVPSVSVSGSSASVSWSAPIDDGGLPVSGYTLAATDLTDAARGGESVSVGGSVTSVTVAGLTPGDSYTFTVTPSGLLGVGLGVASGSVPVPLPPGPVVAAPPVTTVVTPAPHRGPSRDRLLRSLGELFFPVGSASRFTSLRRTHVYRFVYRPLEPGRVLVRWYRVSFTGRGRHRRRHLSLIASGSSRTRGSRRADVRVRLTALGLRLVRAGHPLRLTAVVSFAAPHLRLVLRRHTFVLR